MTNPTTKKSTQPKNILLIHYHEAFGGAETHILKLYKELLNLGHKVFLLVPTNSIIEKILKKDGLSCLTSKAFYLFHRSKFMHKILLAKDIYKACKGNNIQIINCNADCELKAAKLVSKFLTIKITFTRHVPESDPISKSRIKNVDGVIAVSSSIKTQFQNLNKQYRLGIKNIEFIAPFFNDENIINFKPRESKEVFFKNNFNITINQNPILCMAASMHDDRKNHTFLINAIHKLVYEKSTPVQLMLAGSGPMLESYKHLVKDLRLESYIYFLGFTNKAVELLFHSDINLLPSKKEGLSIALMEAALMKKPTIGSAGVTGIIDVVIHNKTGLLIDLTNVDDFANKIEYLCSNKALQLEFGNNAFELVKDNYSTKIKLQKFEGFLNGI